MQVVVRGALLALAVLASGCSSPEKTWVGRYAPVDGSWEPRPGAAPLVTIGRVTEEQATGAIFATATITDRADHALPLTLRGTEPGALFAEEVDLGPGLVLPTQEIAAGGGALRVGEATVKVKGPARVALIQSQQEGAYLLQVVPSADSSKAAEVHVVRLPPPPER